MEMRVRRQLVQEELEKERERDRKRQQEEGKQANPGGFWNSMYDKINDFANRLEDGDGNDNE